MILTFIDDINSADALIQSASKLSVQLGKSFGVMSFVADNKLVATRRDELNKRVADLQIENVFVLVRQAELNVLPAVCEESEASFLFIQLPDKQIKHLRNWLNYCRNLRIPYIFFRESFTTFHLSRIILPVGFLEEEMEKAQFASAFGRFCGSEIKMLLANDYGSKAAINAAKMKEFFDRFKFEYSLEKAARDSFKVDAEAIATAEKEQAGMVIVSASRDYGLDDLLFGPKEYHLVKKSSVPVLLVNPRGDLYALCD
jgi:hypothetical protein